MTEAEAIESLTNIGQVGASYAGLWLSSTFAFLTVCYFVGKALSTFECLVVSALYGTSGFSFAAAFIGYQESWFKLKAEVDTVMDNVWVFEGMEKYIGVAAFILFGGTFVSLYFMYNVRHRQES